MEKGFGLMPGACKSGFSKELEGCEPLNGRAGTSRMGRSIRKDQPLGNFRRHAPPCAVYFSRFPGTGKTVMGIGNGIWESHGFVRHIAQSWL